jgi:predicted esterase
MQARAVTGSLRPVYGDMPEESCHGSERQPPRNNLCDPPVLLVHGTGDSRVPLQSMTEAEAALRAAGLPVETLACVGTEHSIDQEGLLLGGHFLHQMPSAPGH